MTLFDRVKSAADSRGYTLAELSRAAGIGEKSIYAWKPSKNYPEGIHPKKATLQKIADVLGVSVDYLLGNTDEMYPTNSQKDDDLNPEDIVVLNKIRTAGLNDEQLQKLDDYIEFLKYDYIREMQDDE